MMEPQLFTEDPIIQKRRERVFILLSGIFLGSLAMLNILGISRFLYIASWNSIGGLSLGTSGDITFAVAVGVLPYPITFLCTDLISELYGRSRANFVVWVGVILNLWIVFILWIGGLIPGTEAPEYMYIRSLTFGTVLASMVAYLAAQFSDVHIFHFLKSITKGKHLWLRNNGSTLISQLVDTTAVILITHYYARALPLDIQKPVFEQLVIFIITGYVFKVLIALLDTGPFYLGTFYLSKYLKIDSVLTQPKG
ncbi:MAG: queuosine precursor transporter [Fidelibacterota bacterium]|jgi:uncharacterized integral membrane protein (TIGR00697 family)